MNICAFHLNSHTHSPKPSKHYSILPTLKLLGQNRRINYTTFSCTSRRKSPSSLKHTPSPPKPITLLSANLETSNNQTPIIQDEHAVPRWVYLGGASLGLALLILGVDGQHEALAFGPEGPLVEEFWDNMRRYGLYVLTVSTGVIYTILQPIVELLKNPITAILIIVIVVGSGYLVSQVLNAMVGISEFSYNYAY